MTALIVEDDPVQASSLTLVIRNRFPNIECLTVSSYDAALPLLVEYSFDFFMLDIVLDKEKHRSGIHLGKHIRSFEKYKTTPIIFITSFPEHMPEAINLIHCYSFLIKPYDDVALCEALRSLLRIIHPSHNEIALHDVNGILYHLKSDEILYIQVMGHILKIYTANNCFETRDCSLSELCERIPEGLWQCHKSYAVNPFAVHTLDWTTRSIHIRGLTDLIPIGRHFQKKLKGLKQQ